MGKRRQLDSQVAQVVNKGGEELEKLGLAKFSRSKYLITEEGIEEIDALYRALHSNNPQNLSPEMVKIFDDLSKMRDWSEQVALDLDPGMSLRENYFYRGWKPNKELEQALRKYEKTEGMLGGNEGNIGGWQRPANDASYEEMRAFGFEPLFWNPYEQWGYRHLVAERYKLITAFKAMLQAADLAKPMAQGMSLTDNWVVPKIGTAFEGTLVGGIRLGRTEVPQEIAHRL